MKLEHSFSVPVGIDEAWKILLDIERIGPCMPGAAIDSVDGDDFTGTVKVKLGPIGLTYKGKASFIEKDEAAHRAVIDARGRDARGNGTASAKVTAVLTEQGSNETKVLVNTDLDITGKPAQFGRGVMVDVGNKLIGQFADQLAATITEGEGITEAPAEPAKAPARKRTTRPKSASADEAGSSTVGAAPAGADQPIVEEAALKAVAEAPAAFSAPSEPSDSAVNGQPKKAYTPPREVEPINLIEHAGPAVAKRLAPVVAVLVLILIVVRLRKRS